jgi:hypothetical protein
MTVISPQQYEALKKYYEHVRPAGCMLKMCWCKVDRPCQKHVEQARAALKALQDKAATTH